MYHSPVLLHDSIKGLNIRPDGVYMDVTFGGGGHSREVLKYLTSGKLYAFDQDEDAVKNKIEDDRFTLIQQNFRYLKDALYAHEALPVNGILADLGVSSHQFDVAERGFSLRFEGELDMRMDQGAEKTAKEVVNTYSEEELKKIFAEYGELPKAGKIAWLIAKRRSEGEIKTVNDLKETLRPMAKKPKEHQFYAKVFQALRIEVNDEIEVLKEFLQQSLEVLDRGGRLVVISYHSLEDRLVKNFMKSGNFEGEVEKDFFGNQVSPFTLITRKAIVPSEEEIEQNNRARSAKLRIAEKI